MQTDMAAPDSAQSAGVRSPQSSAAPDLAARLERWLTSTWKAKVVVSGWRRFPAGMSWVTFGFTATMHGEPQDLILRLGDPGGLFAPYRTEPEFLALSTLARAPGVPIPEALLRCDDPAVLGAPFMITRKVAGDTPTPWDGAASRVES